ncbi:unnamed protein product [Ilex paraguariensis]|uniref:Uncharacterized protein n=1 Tax=Ilex paraguariensis TaxID=185542 RepID=A0ABC8SFZ9_9AQUA
MPTPSSKSGNTKSCNILDEEESLFAKHKGRNNGRKREEPLTEVGGGGGSSRTDYQRVEDVELRKLVVGWCLMEVVAELLVMVTVQSLAGTGGPYRPNVNGRERK